MPFATIRFLVAVLVKVGGPCLVFFGDFEPDILKASER